MGLRQGDGGPLTGGIRRQGDSGAFGASGPLAAGGALGAGGGARRGFQNNLSGGNLFGKRPLDLTSLALTPEQKQRIQAMRGQVGPKTRELRKTLNAKRAELRDMMFEASAGDDQVRAKRKEVRQLQDKVEEMQLNDFLSIRSVLTPDQRQKLTDLKPAGATKFAAGNGPTQMVAPVITQP
jgi:Spy/CpxP family protein refolding chaperone